MPGQTETDWGTIWDTLPADFPMFDGAIPSEESATGPASAILVVEGVDAASVATWTASRLRDSGYAIDGDTSALEDGSYVLEGPSAPTARSVSTWRHSGR